MALAQTLSSTVVVFNPPSPPTCSQLPRPMANGRMARCQWRTALTTIFHMFRANRNEAGHPSGKMLSREEAYAKITAFPFYVRKVYELIDWLKASGPLS